MVKSLFAIAKVYDSELTKIAKPTKEKPATKTKKDKKSLKPEDEKKVKAYIEYLINKEAKKNSFEEYPLESESEDFDAPIPVKPRNDDWGIDSEFDNDDEFGLFGDENTDSNLESKPEYKDYLNKSHGVPLSEIDLETGDLFEDDDDDEDEDFLKEDDGDLDSDPFDDEKLDSFGSALSLMKKLAQYEDEFRGFDVDEDEENDDDDDILNQPDLFDDYDMSDDDI